MNLKSILLGILALGTATHANAEVNLSLNLVYPLNIITVSYDINSQWCPEPLKFQVSKVSTVNITAQMSNATCSRTASTRNIVEQNILVSSSGLATMAFPSDFDGTLSVKTSEFHKGHINCKSDVNQGDLVVDLYGYINKVGDKYSFSSLYLDVNFNYEGAPIIDHISILPDGSGDELLEPVDFTLDKNGLISMNIKAGADLDHPPILEAELQLTNVDLTTGLGDLSVLYSEIDSLGKSKSGSYTKRNITCKIVE